MLKAMHGAAWTHILLKQYLMRKSPNFQNLLNCMHSASVGHFAKKDFTF